MRLFLLRLVLVNLFLVPGTLGAACSVEEQQSYLVKLNFEMSQIGTLLARVQESFDGPLNYYDLTQHLLTLETSDLQTLLREGRLFAETILDSNTTAAREFSMYADFRDRTRLVVHTGKTLIKLRRLEAMCGGPTKRNLSSVSRTDLVFEDVVSSFAKYKIHLRNLIRNQQ